MSDVALWYLNHGSTYYDLYDDEGEAALVGAVMEDEGNAVVLGAQFPDGRAIAKADWAPLHAAKRRLIENAFKAERKRAAAPPKSVRRILDPFRGQPVAADEDKPGWLGRAAR